MTDSLPFIWLVLGVAHRIGERWNPHWDPDYQFTCGDIPEPVILDWNSLTILEATLMGWHGEARFVKLYRHWYL